jgi:hypothetical protein
MEEKADAVKLMMNWPIGILTKSLGQSKVYGATCKNWDGQIKSSLNRTNHPNQVKLE